MNNLNILYNEMMDFLDNLEPDLLGVPLSNNHMLGPMSQRGPFCNYYPVFYLKHLTLEASSILESTKRWIPSPKKFSGNQLVHMIKSILNFGQTSKYLIISDIYWYIMYNATYIFWRPEGQSRVKVPVIALWCTMSLSIRSCLDSKKNFLVHRFLAKKYCFTNLFLWYPWKNAADFSHLKNWKFPDFEGPRCREDFFFVPMASSVDSVKL